MVKEGSEIERTIDIRKRQIERSKKYKDTYIEGSKKDKKIERVKVPKIDRYILQIDRQIEWNTKERQKDRKRARIRKIYFTRRKQIMLMIIFRFFFCIMCKISFA